MHHPLVVAPNEIEDQNEHEGVKSSVRKFPCQWCNKSYTQSHSLKTHINSVHKKFNDKTVTNLNDPSVQKDPKKFSCKSCEKSFNYPSNLSTHKKTVHEGIKFKCDSCEKGFASKQGLGTHNESVHEKIRINCNFCEKSFTQKGAHKLHIKSFHDNCDICNKNFADSQSLRNHQMKSHNETTIETNNKLCQDVADRNNSDKVEIVEQEIEHDEHDLKIMREVKTEIDQDEPMQAVAPTEIKDQNDHEGSNTPAVEEFSFTPQQIDQLEDFFRTKQYINIFEIEQFATTGTYPNYAKVQQWFAKRREEIGNVENQTRT